MGTTLTPEEIDAEEAGLRYIDTHTPGITRHRAGKGFFYRSPAGTHITDQSKLKRIRSLVIPPAWTDVWIAPSASAHIQATGRDERGRKQYRYHPDWITQRDETKFAHLIEFARVLPGIRSHVRRDLTASTGSRDQVIATVVALLEQSLIRVGNEEYAESNQSYGLTTMEDRHASISGSHITFAFAGKSGVEHEIDVDNRRLARIVRKCQDIPGQRLFQYVGENGDAHPINSEDVNDYLDRITDRHFTAKDFRTWSGTVLAAQSLAKLPSATSEREARAAVVGVVDEVAGVLGNTRAVCRKAYIHPAVIEAWMHGTTIADIDPPSRPVGLRKSERAVIELIERGS